MAESANPEIELEQQLRRVIFCQPPYFSEQRRRQKYSEFDVRPMDVTERVLRQTGGWIDRDEFDLFLSRIRDEGEIDWAVDGVNLFRSASADARAYSIRLVKQTGPLEDKVYLNWRDMGPHTFSLLALGSSFIRIGNRLVLVGDLAAPQAAAAAGVEDDRTEIVERTLLIPDVPDGPDDGALPPVVEMNDGRSGEILVSKLLRSNGWHVVPYGQRRGFGFDIWAKKDQAVIYVEVKSSLGPAGQISLTNLELMAARRYGANYLLVIVEYLTRADQRLWVIQNPANQLQMGQRTVIDHLVGEAAWRRVAVTFEGPA